VEFTAGSAQVVVCGYCQTVVAKKGANLEAHGKISAIVDTDSPLSLGLEGRYAKVGYRLVGHVQKDHGAGPWDEWYVEFDDERTGWLSEAEGHFYMMFEAGVEEGLELDSLHPGERLHLRNRAFVVEERGHGKVVAAVLGLVTALGLGSLGEAHAIPPTAEATTGTPCAAASSTAIGQFSHHSAGRTATAAARSSAATSDGGSGPRTSTGSRSRSTARARGLVWRSRRGRRSAVGWDRRWRRAASRPGRHRPLSRRAPCRSSGSRR